VNFMAARITVGVIGSGDELPQDLYQLAFDIGALIAQRGAVLVCGGLGGVMAAAARGAAEQNGTVVGILPGTDKAAANDHVHIALPTGMGVARNALVAHASDAIIALPGAFGTVSEMAIALDSGKSVVLLPGAADLRKAAPLHGGRVLEAADARQAVGMALGEIGRKKRE
jgi:uncharacterized protein (TIGR00725 family)